MATGVRNLLERGSLALKACARHVSGATALEYGILTAGIAGALVVTIFLIGEDTRATLEAIVDAFEGTEQGPEFSDKN